MTEVPLPVDGPALVAGIELPAGQRIYGWDDDVTDVGIPLAWVTVRPMTDAGNAWLALSAAHAKTGLVPVLLSRAGGMNDVSGEAFGLSGTEDISLIDSMSPEEVLAAHWDLSEWEEFNAYEAGWRAPFGAEFPGLAPAGRKPLDSARLRSAVAMEDRTFLALVAVGRPADVPAAIGWSVFGADSPGRPDAISLEISTVLRSWETRFGARPLRIGSDAILRVLVDRPPSTLEAATAVAAEHLAFADECNGRSGYSVCDLAADLVGKPVWHFWWD